MAYAIPKSVYHSKLNGQAVFHAFTPLSAVREQFAPALRDIADALVVSPHVTLDISNTLSRANLPLALLVDYFGIEVVRELLRERALRFLFRRSSVQLSTTGTGSHHPLGLEAEIEVDDEDCDGERLARAALTEAATLVDDDRRIGELAQLAAAVTEFTRPQTAEEAVELATIALDQPEFAFRASVISKYPPDKVPDEHRQWGLQLAHHILTASVLREYELDFFEEEASWDALIDVVAKVHSSEFVLRTTERILDLERVYSIPALLRDGVLRPVDILRVRHAPGTLQFRRWLWSQPDPLDTEEVFAAYRTALIGEPQELERAAWFRAVKVTVLEFVGSAIEQAAKAGAEVGGIGGPASEAVSKTARIASDYAGEYLIERIVRPADPRAFADTLRRLEAERTVTSIGPRRYSPGAAVK